MTDHAEEQEMEAEALQAIFDTHFSILGPGKWSVEIYPEMTTEQDELDQLNHVGVTLVAELPADYPEALPVLDCEIIKGLVDEHKQELLELAKEESVANEGVPSIFAIAERLREWLVENNQKGLDDLSMHAQMVRKQQAKEKVVRLHGSETTQRECNPSFHDFSWKNVTLFHTLELWRVKELLQYCAVKILCLIGVVGDRRQGGCQTWLF